MELYKLASQPEEKTPGKVEEKDMKNGDVRIMKDCHHQRGIVSR